MKQDNTQIKVKYSEDEVKDKVINNLEKAEIVTSIKHPDQLGVVMSFTNLIRSFRDVNYLYWYLKIKYVLNRNENFERFKWMDNEVYNGEKLHTAESIPSYITELLGYEPKRPLIVDLKKGQNYTKGEIYAVFGKGNDRRTISVRSEFNALVVIDYLSQKSNIWPNNETLWLKICDYNDQGEYVGKKKWQPVVENLKKIILSNSANIFVFESGHPKINKFVGKFFCSSIEKKEIKNDPNVKYREYLILKILNENQFVETVTQQPSELQHTFLEGNLLSKKILFRNRNIKVRDAYLSLHGSRCHLCGAELTKHNSNEPIIDVHHLHSISLGERNTDVEHDLVDLVGLCPNCHRWVHSIKCDHELTFEEIKEIFQGDK